MPEQMSIKKHFFYVISRLALKNEQHIKKEELSASITELLGQPYISFYWYTYVCPEFCINLRVISEKTKINGCQENLSTIVKHIYFKITLQRNFKIYN